MAGWKRADPYRRESIPPSEAHLCQLAFCAPPPAVPLSRPWIAELARSSDEGVGARAVLPLRPVPVEQRVGHVRLQLAVAPAVGDAFVAGVVAAAFGIDVIGEGDPFPVRRPERIGDAGGDRRERMGLAAAEGKKPEVRLP